MIGLLTTLTHINLKMNKSYTVLLILLIASTINSGCNRKERKQSSETKLVVSIAPLKEVVSSIAGNQFNVEVLLPPGANHETYEPSPKDIMKLDRSAIYFGTGLLDFEKNWLNRFSNMYPDLPLINLSEGIFLLSGHEHDHGESHGTDPHIWLSVSALKIQAENTCKALIEQFPDQEDTFKTNLESFLHRAGQTDSIIKQNLSSLKSRTFLIYHPSLAYFARDYGLIQVSIEEEGKEPSPSSLRKIIDLVKKENLKFILVSKEFDTRNAGAIASETGTKLIVFDPMSSEWEMNLEKIAAIIAENQ